MDIEAALDELDNRIAALEEAAAQPGERGEAGAEGAEGAEGPAPTIAPPEPVTAFNEEKGYNPNELVVENEKVFINTHKIPAGSKAKKPSEDPEHWKEVGGGLKIAEAQAIAIEHEQKANGETTVEIIKASPKDRLVTIPFKVQELTGEGAECVAVVEIPGVVAPQWAVQNSTVETQFIAGAITVLVRKGENLSVKMQCEHLGAVKSFRMNPPIYWDLD